MSQNSTTHGPFLATSSLVASEFQPSPFKEGTILKGQPQSKSRHIATSPDERLSTWIWDCSAGTFSWHFEFDEIVHILEGGVNVKDSTGKVTALKVSDVVYFKKGITTEWEVPVYVKKLAIHRHTQEPLLKRILKKLKITSQA